MFDSDKNRFIGFKVMSPRDAIGGGGYRKLPISIGVYNREDAALRITQSLSRDADTVAYYVKKAKAVVEATGGAEYFSESFSGELEFEWQDDAEQRDNWYGAHIRLSTETAMVAVLNKIAKAVEKAGVSFERIKPRQLVAILLDLKAVPLRYLNAISNHVRVEDFDVAEVIPEPKVAETEKEVEAATV